MKAWEGLGRKPVDRRGEMRDKFYLHTGRRKGQAIQDYIGYFNELFGEMQKRSVPIDAETAAYCLHKWLNLDDWQRNLIGMRHPDGYTQKELEGTKRVLLLKDLHAT